MASPTSRTTTGAGRAIVQLPLTEIPRMNSRLQPSSAFSMIVSRYRTSGSTVSRQESVHPGFTGPRFRPKQPLSRHALPMAGRLAAIAVNPRASSSFRYQRPRIGRDPGVMEFELQFAVKSQPQRFPAPLTHWIARYSRLPCQDQPVFTGTNDALLCQDCRTHLGNPGLVLVGPAVRSDTRFFDAPAGEGAVWAVG